jgi:hypothetical protein
MKPDLQPKGPTRWDLIRDLVVFQFKLAIDALRDVVMSPVSIVAGLLDLILEGDRPRHLYRVLLLGRQTERWINLFGEADRVETRTVPTGDEDPSDSLDTIVGQVEELIVQEYERGGVTASAKAAIDRSLDILTGKRGEERR